MIDEFQSKVERNHQAIIEAAYNLFLEQGFAATSVRQIAGRAGLALGGIYNHFASKEAIFSDLIIAKHPFREILPLLLAAPGATVDFVKLFFVELVEFNGRDIPRMYQVIYPQIAPLMQRFQTCRGELREIPPFVLIRAFLGLFFSYYMTEFLLAGTPVAELQENALDHFVDIFLNGVLANKETE
jgi:AcrR family transcriptional regulator